MILHLNKISFQYQGQTQLFHDLDWQLAAGKICGLFGKNGAGKSTLLKLISGLVFPKGGNCEVLNEQPQKRTANFLADIFHLTEEFWLPNITAKKYGELFSLFYPKFSRESFKINCQEFGVDLNSNLHEISYSQKNTVTPNAALYQEKILGSSHIIRPNKNNTETPVDLELLFKAVLVNAENINSCFQRGAK